MYLEFQRRIVECIVVVVVVLVVSNKNDKNNFEDVAAGQKEG